jgi:hypothetical protein
MRYYQHDEEGWLLGWHEDSTRARSVPIEPPRNVPGVQVRWDSNANTWKIDPSREQAQIAAENAELNKRQQAIALCRSYNPDTATASEVRTTLAASLYLLRQIFKDD